MFKYLLLIIPVFTFFSAKGIDQAPFLKRVCISNAGDSVVNISWDKPTDTCNSFKTYHIYGRENNFLLFSLLDSVNNINIETHSIKLPNQVLTWEFYIVAKFACNGTDTFNSNTVEIDRIRPPTSTIDSVSVDLITQKIITGWQKNTAPDTKDYIFYEVIGGTPQIKTRTSATFHLDNLSNPATGPLQYSIAAADSCENLAPISPPHTSIFLNKNIDTCSRTITLNWTPYIGWQSISKYLILLSVNKGSFQEIGNTTNNTYNYTPYNPGDTFCFFIRAVNGLNPTITSSSNLICFTTRTPLLPTFNYLSKVSVVNNKDISISWFVDTKADITNFKILRSDDSINFKLISIVTNTLLPTQNYIDKTVNPQTKKYHYQIEAVNSCGNTISNSNISNSLLLSLITSDPTAILLNWNNYNNWDGGVDQYHLRRGIDLLQSSTWNIINSFPINPITYNDTDIDSIIPGNQGICYIIEAEEGTTNQFGLQENSFSNIICATRDMTIFFPNAFKPTGINNIFLPKGTFIDYTTSNLTIINRWGEILYKTANIKEGWNGKDSNGNILQDGNYIFIANIQALNGKLKTIKGTITLLK